jgi:CRISPR-associated protein Cas2
MKRANFIIAYDISNVKRLAKIAKTIEKEAFRIQRSIFFYPDASIEELSRLIEKIVNILHKNKDDLRVYKIKKGSIALQSAIDLDNPDIFLELK